MDKLKALNSYTNLLALILIFVGCLLLIRNEREGGQTLIGGGLLMLRSGAEHAVEK